MAQPQQPARGRPRLGLDVQEIERLLNASFTREEIAEILQVSSLCAALASASTLALPASVPF